MVRPAVRKVRATRAERRDQIAQKLLSAAERFVVDGASFTEISVEQLITEAEIARSTFYMYFEDKGALLLELTDRVTVTMGQAALAWLELPPKSSRSQLRDALNRVVEAYFTHRHILAAVAEAAAYDPRVRAQYGEVMARRIEFITEHFLEQQRQGAVRPDVDVPSVTPWITWMIERCLYQWLGHDTRDQSEFTTPDFTEGLTSVIWYTFYEGIG
ncbi:TetR/AcrR family transcriptional regulator [Nocardia neocaledoniensis]|uniref:TetR/AcrR family transcriptional regulator n=1 Tax=Nocardia neocaledoniensis TaxID=236511 RepID=UPI0024578DAF|nr:TetR/AcrR family transcriptional regulator [Nocardia neocaledoniensis]